MLQIVENLDIGIVGRTIERQKFAQSVFVIILIGQLQDGFLGYQTQPRKGRTGQLVCPCATRYEPRMDNAGKFAGCREVDNDVSVVMNLQERSRNGIAHAAFDRCLDDIGFLFAPRRQENLARSKDIGNSQRNRTRRNGFLRAEAHGHFLTTGGINQNQTG